MVFTWFAYRSRKTVVTKGTLHTDCDVVTATDLK